MLTRLKQLKRRSIVAIIIVVLVLSAWFGGRNAQPSYAMITWVVPGPSVSADYLGVAIDAAMLTGGEWWAGSDSPPLPIALDHPDLVAFTQLLAPKWIRLGGTEADKLWLAEPDEPSDAASQLTRTDIDSFLGFTKQAGAKPFITVNAGPLTREQGEWQPQQLQRLLKWLGPNYNGVLEWGNEPGAHWLIFGRSHQIPFSQLADEFQMAQTLSNSERVPLVGPANAFWPKVGEPLKQMVGSSKDFLSAGAQPDSFTWHYYPTQSQRCGVRTESANWSSLLDDEAIKEFSKQSLQVSQWLRTYAPDTPKWLGETGPAQCGGRANFTDRFGSSLWWLAHLGEAAKTGNQVVIRQSLVGGDYALLSYQRDRYVANPDFWASKLWLQQMGPKSHRVFNIHRNLRAYAHCHPTQTGVMSLVLVNAGKQALDVTLASFAQGQFFDVTSPSLDSQQVLIAGKPAELIEWHRADSLPWRPTSEWRKLPAYSYRWLEMQEPYLCGD